MCFGSSEYILGVFACIWGYCVHLRVLVCIWAVCASLMAQHLPDTPILYPPQHCPFYLSLRGFLVPPGLLQETLLISSSQPEEFEITLISCKVPLNPYTL